nr:hypothetical protein [Tanacetum cinerariifolium]
MEAQPEIIQNISSLKLFMLKTEDCDLWIMRMEQYLTHTDYALWEVIINGDSPVHEPPAVAIPDEHLLKFQIKDAKSLWEAIIISQLELNGKVISHEDANMKLLRSLPPAWNNIVLIMRNNLDIETLSMDDLYNNLKVYEAEIKGQSSSSSNSHNVAFVSSKNTSSINETVNVAHDILAVGSKEQPSASSYAEDTDTDDLEEMDLKWQVLMITMRVKKFMKKTGRNLIQWQGAKSLEDRIRVHQKNETIFEESIAFLKYYVQVRDISIKDLKNQLEEAIKEKDNLKEKLTKFEESSKNLTKLINSQMSPNENIGLGYDSQLSENEMPKCDIFEAASDSSVSETDEDNNQAKDTYKVGIGYHAVPPPYIGNYMPPRANLSFVGLDDSVFKFKISGIRTSVNENESIASKSSEEIREEPKTVRSSAPIIDDWESDFEDECEDKTSTEQDKSSNDNSVNSIECTKNISLKNAQIIMMKTLEKDRILGLIGMV